MLCLNAKLMCPSIPDIEREVVRLTGLHERLRLLPQKRLELQIEVLSNANLNHNKLLAENGEFLEDYECVKATIAWLNGVTEVRPSHTWDIHLGIKRISLIGIGLELNIDTNAIIKNQTATLAALANISEIELFFHDTITISQLAKTSTVRKGHWHGVTNNKTFNARPFIRHIWLQNDNQIIDPIRWFYEGEEPYIYISNIDKQYDEHGEELRKLTTTKPNNVSKHPRITVADSFNVKTTLQSLGFKENSVTVEQLLYLANTPPNHEYMSEVYEWIVALGYKAFIPLDYLTSGNSNKALTN